jgi:hypothetical protein
MRSIRYYFTAFLMGIPWYLLLLPFGSGLPLGGELWPANLFAMCLASLGVAVTFKKKIVSATDNAFILLGILLPYYGAFIFGLFVVLFMAIANLLDNGLLPDAEALMIPFVCMYYGAFMLFFVTIPMGLISQKVMHRVAQGDG